MSDTIFAFSSGAGVSAIAVLRLSGSGVRAVLKEVTGSVPTDRKAVLRELKDPGSGLLIDQAIVVFFPGPSSFTGEDCAEFHVHGSYAVRAALISCLGGFASCRAAEAGEFTKRAFVNGKLDLTAAEGLADLLESKTERQRIEALGLLGGSLAQRIGAWRDVLVRILASVESVIDFSDQEDAPEEFAGSVANGLDELIPDMRRVLEGSGVREIVRDGFRIAICGPPNAGKSSFLNWLAGRNVAIVSEVVGTTRDTLEVFVDLNGFPVIFYDGAGLRRGSEDLVEQLGMERSRQVAKNSNLILWLFDTDSASIPDVDLIESGVEIWPVRTKTDLDHFAGTVGGISVLDGSGVDELRGRIAEHVRNVLFVPDDMVAVGERQSRQISTAVEILSELRGKIDSVPPEIVAFELSTVIRTLRSITGEISVEDVLGDIFSRFCIGK